MADNRYIVQAELHRDGGLPADSIVNTWHFEGDGDASSYPEDLGPWLTAGEALLDRVEAFYSTIGPLLSRHLTGVATITAYNIRDPKPRVPRLTRTHNFSVSSTALPSEVALCISMEGALVPGTVRARRRGRVFIGPLSSANTEDTADQRPTTANLTAMLTAAETLARSTAGTPRLAVYSPTEDPTGLSDASWTDVRYVWMDNAYDTQRRRGQAPNYRETIDLDA